MDQTLADPGAGKIVNECVFRFLMFAALAQAAGAQTSTTCSNTPAYTPCELVFELSDQGRRRASESLQDG